MLAQIRRGAVAGFAGALVMSVSTNAEMRLRGRPPSEAPARTIGRLLGIDTGGERRKGLLTLGGHLVTSVSLGAARGVMDRAGVPARQAGVALFGLAMIPELVIVPALGASPPPWRWGAVETAISAAHHGVYAGVTNKTYGLLDLRR